MVLTLLTSKHTISKVIQINRNRVNLTALSDISNCFVNDCFVLILDSCPSQYAKIAGLCIYVSSKNEKKNYADAKEYCKSINGKLYEPRNRSQYETLRTYLEVITCLSN